MYKSFLKGDDTSKYYTFECNPTMAYGQDRDEYVKEGYVELFDDRIFTNLAGGSHTILLENDFEIPKEIGEFASTIYRFGGKNMTYKPFTGLTPATVKEIYEYCTNGTTWLRPHKVQNVCIDSLFQNREQFNFIIEKLFLAVRFKLGYKMNFFINSHGKLLDVMNEEHAKWMTENKDKASIHYSPIQDMCRLNRIYDIDFHTMMCHHVRFGTSHGDRSFNHTEAYKFLHPLPPRVKHPMDDEKEQSNPWKSENV